jgi:hypothetical protein
MHGLLRHSERGGLAEQGQRISVFRQFSEPLDARRQSQRKIAG